MSLVITREEIGDPFAAMERRRQMMRPKTPVVTIARPVAPKLDPQQERLARLKAMASQEIVKIGKRWVVQQKAPNPELTPEEKGARHLYAGYIVGPVRPESPHWAALKFTLPKPKVEDCIRYVCMTFGLQRDELLSHRRTNALVMPRHIAMYLAKVKTTRSLPEIGNIFNRDHTVVLYAHRKISELVESGSFKPPTEAEFWAAIGRCHRPAGPSDEA